MAEVLNRTGDRSKSRGSLNSTMNVSRRSGAGASAGGTETRLMSRGGGSRASSSRGSRPQSAGGNAAAMHAARKPGAPATYKVSKSQEARMRVEEKRQVTEAQFWGRESVGGPAVDIPAFWSTEAFGQPCNDVRLTIGSGARWKVDGAGPTLKLPRPKMAGPATEQLESMRASLRKGEHFLTGQRMSSDEREQIILALPPHHRIHALCKCQDRDTSSPDFIPWTQEIDPILDGTEWFKDRERTIRLAVQRLEQMMLAHVGFETEARCKAARAPFTNAKDLLTRQFIIVDPHNTGRISVQQFLQVWQNNLRLREYEERWEQNPVTKRSSRTLIPGRRLILSRGAAAALFVKYGFDKDGLLPYKVFVNAICSTPARLLGFETVLDNAALGHNGLKNEADVALAMQGAKILYPKSRTGVFPPSGFETDEAFRSQKAPRATMFLEHAYGYAGRKALASNLWYNDRGELVYYVAGVGVVFNKEEHLAGRPSQRFFFGHDNDIECLTIHPNRRFAASGQQLKAGGRPYVAVWDTHTMCQIQRIDHDKECRSVIGVAFSGDRSTSWSAAKDKRGDGSILVTITGDNKHTVWVWRWMTHDNALFKASYIPGWCWGPEKKWGELEATGVYFRGDNESDDEEDLEAVKEVPEDHPGMRVLENARRKDVPKLAMRGFGGSAMRPNTVQSGDGSFELMTEGMPSYNGTPPQVFGVAWNPFRRQRGGPGSEFCTYGTKHLKTWYMDEDTREWITTNAQYNNNAVHDIKAVEWVPARHQRRAPGDSCIVTGFPDGSMGVWVPPFPTRAGAVYLLVTVVRNAHGPGPKIGTSADGNAIYSGIAALKLRADNSTLLSGGGDGRVRSWMLAPPRGDPERARGVSLRALGEGEKRGPHDFDLTDDFESNEGAPIIKSLDTMQDMGDVFIAGTAQEDIWEVDDSPQVLIDGHMDDINKVACHPKDADVFATCDITGRVYLWNARGRVLLRSATMQMQCIAIDFSKEPVARDRKLYPQWQQPAGEKGAAGGYHLAIGGAKGRLIVLDAVTLQPIIYHRRFQKEIREVRYSPAGCGTRFLAAAGLDLVVHIFNVDKGYQFVSKCVGHAASIEFLDWSLPLTEGPEYLRKQCILMSQCSATEVLYFDPRTGKKVPENQRDLLMATWTGPFGFPVMGIWPDGSDRTDVNAVCRSARGAATWDEERDLPRVPEKDVCPENVRGAGYLVTGDDYSTVRLFNYPCVWDDAPCREFMGHSSHVSDIRFSHDDRRVFSVGGNDQAVLQWRTIGVNVDDREYDQKILDAVGAEHRLAENHCPLFDQAVWENSENPQAAAILRGASEEKAAPPAPTLHDVREETIEEGEERADEAERKLPEPWTAEEVEDAAEGPPRESVEEVSEGGGELEPVPDSVWPRSQEVAEIKEESVEDEAEPVAEGSWPAVGAEVHHDDDNYVPQEEHGRYSAMDSRGFVSEELEEKGGGFDVEEDDIDATAPRQVGAGATQFV
ncbi:unnamed protein product [Pedinophyceae sp. YPF-701]|nr:unnamed protein product [Pedinophyceae sp. YPF-701]